MLDRGLWGRMSGDALCADLMNTLWEADVVVFKAHITTGPGGKVLDMFWIYDNRCELPENHRCGAVLRFARDLAAVTFMLAACMLIVNRPPNALVCRLAAFPQQLMPYLRRLMAPCEEALQPYSTAVWAVNMSEAAPQVIGTACSCSQALAVQGAADH